MSIRLRVQPLHGTASDYDVDGPDVTIGRSTAASIVIPDTGVSRQHARIALRDGTWSVEDLGARNPTLLNDQPLVGTAALRAGDRLQVGDSVVCFLGDSASALSEAAAAELLRGAPDATRPLGGEKDAARLRTLNEVHRALAGPQTLAEVLDLILARCFDVLQPEEGAILLRGADGVLTTAASRSPSGGPVSVPRRLIDEVAGKGQPALVLDAASDGRFASSDSIVSSGILSIVAAPLIDAEGTLGLITLCSRLNVRRFAPPDLDMLVSIASAAALRVRNVALADALAARRVIEHELTLAHDVQMSMLPREVPKRREVALGAGLRSARSVGGDLYDFILDGDRLWFIVADVAGKSIAAALYMAIVRTLFRALAGNAAGVEVVADRMNRALARDNDRLMFVTAAIGCLELASGGLTVVDAGHNPVLEVGAGGVVRALAMPKGMALGVVENAGYQPVCVTLEPGTTILLFTDGMTDARNGAGETFGTERLTQAIASGGGTADGLVASVMRAVDAFVAGAPAEDDLTVLAVRYEGGGSGA